MKTTIEDIAEDAARRVLTIHPVERGECLCCEAKRLSFTEAAGLAAFDATWITAALCGATRHLALCSEHSDMIRSVANAGLAKGMQEKGDES
jgi:hypothetical protein